MTEKTQLFQFAGERPAEKTEAEKKEKMVSGPAGGSRAFSESSCAGLPFLWADHDEGSLVYGSEKLFRHAVPGISVWNRYDGKRYFLDDLVRRQNIAGDRSAFYADFHCDCRSLRRSQRMCTGVAGRASDAADRDLFVGAESSSCHFSSGRCGKIQCDYDFCRDRNDKLDKHCKGCADRSTADPEQ